MTGVRGRFIIGAVAAFALAGSLSGAPSAYAGPTPGQPCSDYDRLGYDDYGNQVVCGANDSGSTARQVWIYAGGLTGNYVPGSPCPNAPQGFPFRSADGYRVMCILADDGSAYLPGGVELHNVTIPVWQLFSA